MTRRCAAAIRATPLPDELRDELAARYEELASEAGDPSPPVAVRSSAIGEDSAEATFAGQQETFLWVRGVDRVYEAVRDCWASLYSPEAVSYRARDGRGGRAPAMGVTVQLMVDAAVSGVMFTCNPVNGDPSTVAVNASWGLGLAVVGGEVTPDEYRVSKVTREVLLRVRSAPKHARVSARPVGQRCRAGRGPGRAPGRGVPGRASSSARWWTSPGRSSATSAATRTSSGRSRATAASCSCSRRGR